MVFTHGGKGGLSMTSQLRRLLRELGIAAVPHGFRSTFRDWAGEETDHPREVIEAALAHVVRNRVEAAYARSDLFERRRVLMDDWARYLAQGTRLPPFQVLIDKAARRPEAGQVWRAQARSPDRHAARLTVEKARTIRRSRPSMHFSVPAGIDCGRAVLTPL